MERCEFIADADVSQNTLDVVLNREGLRLLIKDLEHLQDNQTDHFHLFSEAWGGYQLTNSPDVKQAFNKVTFYLIADKGDG